MKILIFGKGFIGEHFKQFFGLDAEFSEHRIDSYQEIFDELESKKPDLVLNCAGKTGRPNVDWCELHKMETLDSNVTAPLLLAKACEKLKIYMVHVGSGCIYQGDNGGKGFTEEDPPNFFGSFYSKTKAWSEAMLREFPILQLRLRMPVDTAPGPRNFITKIVGYPQVASVENSISVIPDFLLASKALIEAREIGVFNMTNPGAINHKEILEMYREIVDPNFTYQLIPMEDLEKKLLAGRSNCLLSSKKLEARGVFMRPIYEAVRSALDDYAKLVHAS